MVSHTKNMNDFHFYQEACFTFEYCLFIHLNQYQCDHNYFVELSTYIN